MTTDEPSTLTAVAEHEAGRLDRAESIYRTRLAQHPDDLATLIGLGDVLTDGGQLTEAEELYRRAIALDGESPAAAGAYDGLAAIRQDMGDLEAAIPASKKAAALRGNPEDSFGVGNTLEFLGRQSDAIEMFILAAQQRPGYSQAHIKAAQHLLAAGRAAESIPHYQAAIETNPEIAELHCNLANARRKTGDLTAALNSVRQAIELKPKLAEAHNIMGALWKDRRRPADALESYKRALEINPNFADALNNMAEVLELAGQVESATAMYARAVEIQPESVDFHVNYGNNLLLRGNYETGWREFDWRRLHPKNMGNRVFSQPTWDGSFLVGRTIVVYAEEGLGDAIQFFRFIPLLQQRGARVIVECPAALVPLARQLPGVVDVIVTGTPWPQCHVQCSLLSLPMLMWIGLQSLPREVPYLQAEPEKIAAWKSKLDGCAGKRIGLAWSGNPKHSRNKARSIPVEKLAALTEVPGVSFISLQKDCATLPDSPKLLDLTADLTDFSQTAALIANLDLVITVDTAVAHLAGAMGKPVWILVTALPDWRWLLGREDSPWYPSARLFRQETAGNWGGVVARVCAALAR